MNFIDCIFGCLICSDSKTCTKCNENENYGFYPSGSKYCKLCTGSNGYYSYTGSDTYKHCESRFKLLNLA